MSNNKKSAVKGKKIGDLTEEDISEVKKEIDKKVIEGHELSEKEQAIFEKVLEEAELPTVITDALFKLGKNELDVRYLGNKNFRQMLFRNGALEIVYLKQIMTSLVDVTRLLMIIADKLGVENIIQATDDIIEKQREQLEKTEGVKLPKGKTQKDVKLN